MVISFLNIYFIILRPPQSTLKDPPYISEIPDSISNDNRIISLNKKPSLQDIENIKIISRGSSNSKNEPVVEAQNNKNFSRNSSGGSITFKISSSNESKPHFTLQTSNNKLPPSQFGETNKLVATGQLENYTKVENFSEDNMVAAASIATRDNRKKGVYHASVINESQEAQNKGIISAAEGTTYTIDDATQRKIEDFQAKGEKFLVSDDKSKLKNDAYNKKNVNNESQIIAEKPLISIENKYHDKTSIEHNSLTKISYEDESQAIRPSKFCCTNFCRPVSKDESQKEDSFKCNIF